MLKEAGELTAEEHTAIKYNRLGTEPFDVGRKGAEVFTGKFINEKEISRRPRTCEDIAELRRIVAKRGEGVYKHHSAFELLLAAGSITKSAVGGQKSTTTTSDLNVPTSTKAQAPPILQRDETTALDSKSIRKNRQ